MNQTERLIRDLCRLADEKIRAHMAACLKSIEETTPIAKLPPRVAKAYRSLVKASQMSAEATAIIKAAGFDAPYTPSAREALSRRSEITRDQQHRIRAAADLREREVEKLRTNANVQTIGQPQSVTAPALRALRAELDTLIAPLDREVARLARK